MLDWSLCGARWLHLSSTLVVCGSSLFFIYGYPPAAPGDPNMDAEAWWPRLLVVIASALGVVSAFVWLSSEAAALTGTWGAWLDIVRTTRLGCVLLLRVGLLALTFMACLLLRPSRRLWTILSALGVLCIASFAWTGHGSIGTRDAGQLHRYTDVLHLLVAAIWIGALLPLSIVVARSGSSSSCQPRRAAQALARFSAIGPIVVALLVLSGLVNAWFLVGMHAWSALLHSAYGLTLVAKIVLFGIMLALAAVHRYRTLPALQQSLNDEAASPDWILLRLRTSLVSETAFAALILIAVAVLGTIEPPVAAYFR